MVPYRLYAELGRDRDYLCDQNAGMREAFEIFVDGAARRAGISGSEVQSRVRAMEEVSMRRYAEVPSTSEWDVEACRVTSLMSWILRELRSVHDPSD